jgi:hypothetical protein
MRKKVIIVAGFALMGLVLLFVAQVVRWNKLRDYPEVRTVDLRGPNLTESQLLAIDKNKNAWDFNNYYFVVSRVQQEKRAGFFPFSTIKADTLETKIIKQPIHPPQS